MIFIVVPAFNEEKNIGRVVRDLFEHGFNNVVVVDDGSADDTGAEAGKAGASVLRHAINRGQGAALQTGNEYALNNGAKIVVHFDADGQLCAEDIKPAIERLHSEQFDVVIGSRFLDKRTKMPWTKRHMLLPISRWINNMLTGLKLTDAHNGFRVLNKKALENILITQDKMAHNTEISAQIKKKNLRFAEHPVKVVYSEYGLGVGGGFYILRDLIFARWFKKF